MLPAAAGSAFPGSGTLRFVLRDNAAIHYSTEAIGKMAARLHIVKNAFWIVQFDQIGKDLGHEQSESQGEEGDTGKGKGKGRHRDKKTRIED